MAFGFHIIEYEIMGCQMTRRKRSEFGATDEERWESKWTPTRLVFPSSGHLSSFSVFIFSRGWWLCPAGVIFQRPCVSEPLWVTRMLTLVRSLAVNTGIDMCQVPDYALSDCTTLQHMHCKSTAPIAILVPDSTNGDSEGLVDGARSCQGQARISRWPLGENLFSQIFVSERLTRSPAGFSCNSPLEIMWCNICLQVSMNV